MYTSQLKKASYLVAACALAITPFASHADDVDDLSNLSLDDLLNITVSSASGIEEKLSDAPATMVVVTAKDIKRRGYSDMSELIQDLPGFDSIVTNGTNYLISYQRGYRTPFMQRTLFMINGKVDNNLWSHAAIISRQFSMQSIDKVEVLYGPAGAVYGPNAFLGIINIITKDARNTGDSYANISVQYGSYNTQAVDIAAGGKVGELFFNIGYRNFESDDPSLDDYPYWGYEDERWLSNETVWGPILDHEFHDTPYGEYADFASNRGLFGDISYKDENYGTFKLGWVEYHTDEGYGPYYAFDKTQPNQGWLNGSEHTYLEHRIDINEQFNVKTLMSERSSRIWGGWVEATADWAPDMGMYSYVSISDWNSTNESFLFKQDYDYKASDLIRINGGIKLENKELTKAYDLCGYWIGVYCSSYVDSGGPYGQGDGVIHTSSDEYIIQPGTLSEMPADNIAKTKDKGIYAQMILDWEQWRVNLGARYDTNSVYGSAVNPRGSVIYRVSDTQTFKLLYGKAFQEPAPLQLWGGWSGRAANPNLEPEEATNIEFIYMLQTGSFLHNFSLYKASYKNVIKEEAENAGTRDVVGLEYHGRFAFGNFVDGAEDISGHIYYTYTDAEGSITYDHDSASWLERNEDVGDIAPHKIGTALNMPFSEAMNLNVRANYVSSREVYSRNPLRAEDFETDSYITVDMTFSYDFGPASVNAKIRNLFDEEYYHPGVEGASAGREDGTFSTRSSGFQNSLIPQQGRSFLLSLNWDF